MTEPGLQAAQDSPRPPVWRERRRIEKRAWLDRYVVRALVPG